MSEKDLKIDANEYMPLRDVVFTTLRRAIITGKFKPGQRLMEISLANQLGVSRTPVREAIRKLELEGLVIMIPRRGAQVARITEKSLQDVIEIRMVLENFAAELACERITEEGKATLNHCHQAFIEAVERKDLLEIAEKDEQFHDAIFAATDNGRLINIINNLREQFYRYRMEYVKDISQHTTLIQEHADLVSSICSNDRDSACQIMRTHLQNQQEQIMSVIKENEKEEL